MLTDHDRRQLAGQWAKRWPAAMVNSPYLTPQERAACRRRAARQRRQAATQRAAGQ